MNCPECKSEMIPSQYNCQTCHTVDFVRWTCPFCREVRTEIRTCKHLREGGN